MIVWVCVNNLQEAGLLWWCHASQQTLANESITRHMHDYYVTDVVFENSVFFGSDFDASCACS